MPGPGWEVPSSYPRFREIDEDAPFPRRETSARSDYKPASLPGFESQLGRSYPRFRAIDEPGPFSSGEAQIKAKATEPDTTRASSGRPGKSRVLALSGIVAAGVLAVSIGLAQRGSPGQSSTQSAKLLPPTASQGNRVDRREALPAPAAPRTQSSIAGEAAVADTASLKPRSKPSPAISSPKQKSAQRIARTTSPTAPRARSQGLCDGMGGLDLARCMRPQILAADRQLRDAYRDAVRQGVDPRVLAAYERQWSTMRHRAISDPRGVTANYRQMAHELDAQAARRTDDF